MNRLNNQRRHFFVSFCFSLVAFSIVGCVDLSGARFKSEKKVSPVAADTKSRAPYAKKAQVYDGEVHTMLGGLGVFSTGMQELRDSVSDKYNIPADSDMWYNAGDLTRTIISYYSTHQKHRPIILVGHSLGANEQIKVARNLDKAGIPVDLLVTVDAVSQTIVPPNVKHAMNFYKSGYVPMFSGLPLRAVDPQRTYIENINVGTMKGIAVNHFTIDKEPAVQAIILEEVKKVTGHANRAKA